MLVASAGLYMILAELGDANDEFGGHSLRESATFEGLSRQCPVACKVVFVGASARGKRGEVRLLCLGEAGS